MTQVKPAEVSAILRQQLSGFKSEAELEEVGTVLQVGDGIARIYGLTNAQSGELVEFEGGLQAIVLNLEEDTASYLITCADPNGSQWEQFYEFYLSENFIAKNQILFPELVATHVNS